MQAAGYLISTRAGTRVSAVKAPGAQVWDTYYKGIDVGPRHCDDQEPRPHRRAIDQQHPGQPEA